MGIIATSTPKHFCEGPNLEYEKLIQKEVKPHEVEQLNPGTQESSDVVVKELEPEIDSAIKEAINTPAGNKSRAKVDSEIRAMHGQGFLDTVIALGELFSKKKD